MIGNNNVRFKPFVNTNLNQSITFRGRNEPFDNLTGNIVGTAVGIRTALSDTVVKLFEKNGYPIARNPIAAIGLLASFAVAGNIIGRFLQEKILEKFKN